MEQLKFYGLDLRKDKGALENVRDDSSASKDFEIQSLQGGSSRLSNNNRTRRNAIQIDNDVFTAKRIKRIDWLALKKNTEVSDDDIKSKSIFGFQAYRKDTSELSDHLTLSFDPAEQILSPQSDLNRLGIKKQATVKEKEDEKHPFAFQRVSILEFDKKIIEKDYFDDYDRWQLF